MSTNKPGWIAQAGRDEAARRIRQAESFDRKAAECRKAGLINQAQRWDRMALAERHQAEHFEVSAAAFTRSLP